MTNPAPRDEAHADKDQGESEPFSLTNRWWWSGTFRTVIGIVIAVLQWGPISDGYSNWLNFVMIAVGAAVAVWGVIDLIRDYNNHNKAD